MIVVTHLLGSGHLSRVLTLGRAFAAAGHETHVVSGGFPVPQLDPGPVTLHQLRPLRSDGTDFARLLTREGALAQKADHDARAANLLALLHQIAPAILVTELFPFGRRNLKSEFLALLAAARELAAPPTIFASVRDILAPPSKPEKVAFASETVRAFYDAVLVHSDPAIVPLDRSWPVDAALARRLRYTGFVAPALPPASAEASGEILVSAGGGPVGGALFAVAIAAAKGDDRTWRLLVGGEDGAARRSAISRHAPANVIVEAPRPDFRAMLQGAAASVSLCGYNTALDVLQGGVPAVFVPFDEGGETEQGLRASALAALPGMESIATADLTAARLRAALGRVIGAPARAHHRFGFDGAQEAVRICTRMSA